MKKFFIIVVSEDHCKIGVQNGIIQACHGKLAPMKRMKEGDQFIIYSPKTSMLNGEVLQNFTAIGSVKLGEPYAFVMSNNFIPFRRDVIYEDNIQYVSIKDLLNQLSFTSQKNWGIGLRYGFVEISQDDFMIIYKAMKKF